MKVVDSGYYSLSSSSTIDTYGYIYKDAFTPVDRIVNLLSQDDGRCADHQFKLVTVLQANTTYILVVTTHSSNVTGAFLILVSGPKNVSLNRMGKYV